MGGYPAAFARGSGAGSLPLPSLMPHLLIAKITLGLWSGVVVIALTDAKFTALVAAVASVANTFLVVGLRKHTKEIRETNKTATETLTKAVAENQEMLQTSQDRDVAQDEDTPLDVRLVE
jgi:hypothetical protein